MTTYLDKEPQYNIGDTIEYSTLYWSSDWNGYEVGYPDVDVVGLYSDEEFYYYIDSTQAIVLDVWACEEEEE